MQQTASSGVQQPSTKSTLRLWASLQVSNVLEFCLKYTALTHQWGTCLRAAWLNLHYMLRLTGLVWGPEALLASLTSMCAAEAAQLCLHMLELPQAACLKL